MTIQANVYPAILPTLVIKDGKFSRRTTKRGEDSDWEAGSWVCTLWKAEGEFEVELEANLKSQKGQKVMVSFKGSCIWKVNLMSI